MHERQYSQRWECFCHNMPRDTIFALAEPHSFRNAEQRAEFPTFTTTWLQQIRYQGPDHPDRLFPFGLDLFALSDAASLPRPVLSPSIKTWVNSNKPLPLKARSPTPNISYTPIISPNQNSEEEHQEEERKRDENGKGLDHQEERNEKGQVRARNGRWTSESLDPFLALGNEISEIPSRFLSSEKQYRSKQQACEEQERSAQTSTKAPPAPVESDPSPGKEPLREEQELPEERPKAPSAFAQAEAATAADTAPPEENDHTKSVEEEVKSPVEPKPASEKINKPEEEDSILPPDDDDDDKNRPQVLVLARESHDFNGRESRF
jgi:hypothetical protein